MGTDALDAVYYGSFRVDYDKITKKLTASLVIDGVTKIVNLTKAEIIPGTSTRQPGILLTASSTGTTGSSIELTSTVFPSKTTYDYVELSYDAKRPNPCVVVKVSIP